MSKKLVTGFVGFGALPLTASTNDGDRLLKDLRTHLEDRIESRYDVFAQLATSSIGYMHVRMQDASAELNAELRDFAEQCLRDYHESRAGDIIL